MFTCMKISLHIHVHAYNMMELQIFKTSGGTVLFLSPACYWCGFGEGVLKRSHLLQLDSTLLLLSQLSFPVFSPPLAQRFYFHLLGLC